MADRLTLIVCGGRGYQDRGFVWEVLDRIDGLRGIDSVVQGAADGADRWAAEWGWERGKRVGSYPADWDAHGRKAGPLRNQEMLDEAKPDGVVAFPGGQGTADMVRRAQAAGVIVFDLRDR